MSDDIEVHDSRGNVFEDLGRPNPESRPARAALALALREVIQECGLTKKQTIALLGLTYPELDNLARGRLSRFDVERLMRLMLALGLDVRIQIGPRPNGKARAEITVERVASF